MTDLIASLINSDAIDRDTIKSLIADRDPPLDDDEPASFRNSFSALEQIEIEALITAALNRPQRERPASEASKVNDEPGARDQPRKADNSTAGAKVEENRRCVAGAKTRRCIAGAKARRSSPGPKTLVAAPKLKPTWQDDPFYVPFVALVSRIPTNARSREQVSFPLSPFRNDIFHGLFFSSTNAGKG